MPLFGKPRSLSTRLRLAFLALGLTAIGLTGYQSYRIAHQALEEASYERLTGIRETKKRQVESYFRDMTRIAAGRPDIWLDICVENRNAIVGALDELADHFAVQRAQVLVEVEVPGQLRHLAQEAQAQHHEDCRVVIPGARPETTT